MIAQNTSYIRRNGVQVTVIGCGTLGKGVAAGILANDSLGFDANDMIITARRRDHAKELETLFPELSVTVNNNDTLIWERSHTFPEKIHIFIIATKPHDTRHICAEVYRSIENQTPRPVVLTMCPGITVEQMKGWLPADVPIVRSMPNTPVMVCQGATGIFPCNLVTQTQLDCVIQIFKSISPTVVVLPREDLLDVVASVSGYVHLA
jgi:pyrroline-5-carboxylate reductase